MKYPAHLQDPVRQFVRDFAAVTGNWVWQGWHLPSEVEAWRQEIRVVMESGTDGDVLDVCRVWRGFAENMRKG